MRALSEKYASTKPSIAIRRYQGKSAAAGAAVLSAGFSGGVSALASGTAAGAALVGAGVSPVVGCCGAGAGSAAGGGDGGSGAWARAFVSRAKSAETTKRFRTQGRLRPTPSLARTSFMTSLRQEGESRRAGRLPNWYFRRGPY